MIKSRELADPHSCLNRAAPKEPLFVLRANDPFAAHAVRRWAEMYRKGSVMNARQRAKYEEAMALADEMNEWQMAMRAETPSHVDTEGEPK